MKMEEQTEHGPEKSLLNFDSYSEGSLNILPSVLWRCWLGGRKGIRPVNNWVVGCWRGCLGWGTDMHMAQQMPLPLTVSCSSKSGLVLPSWFLPFWYLLTQVSRTNSRWAVKPLCVCVCMSYSEHSLYTDHNFTAGHNDLRCYKISNEATAFTSVF